MIPSHREVDEGHEGPHLIFINMGDGQNPAFLCYSQVGRVDQGDGQVINLGAPDCLAVGVVDVIVVVVVVVDQGDGQVINLGAPECLAVGVVLHETLHALGRLVELFTEQSCLTRCHT